MWQYNKFRSKKKKKPAATAESTEKVKVKREPNYVDQLDRVFSLYIRLRDAYPNGTIKCISCGKIKPFASFDCGHYWSRSHTATRWDEENCNAECSYCNRMTGGEHMIGYRENLIKKIGQQRFDLLELKAHSTMKRDPFVLQLLIKEYKKKVDALIEEKCIPIKKR